MDLLQVVLRVIHIGAAVVWVGSGVFMFFIVEPTVRALGPQGGAFMAHASEKRKMPVVIGISAILTVLAGLVLYIRDSDGFDPDWITSSVGLSFTIGGIAAILALVIGTAIVRPRAVRLGALAGAMASGQPTQQQIQELQALQGSMRSLSILNLALLAVATVAMAGARFL